MVEITEKAPPEVDRYRQRALIVGAVALVVCLVGVVLDRSQFFKSYLLAFVFWIGIPLGSWAILMLQHMSGGQWGIVIRRVLEASTRTFPWMVLLFIPVALGTALGAIYVWMRPDDAAVSEHLRELIHNKQAYLNLPFFLGRALFYFLVWNIWTYMLNKYSLQQDRTGERQLTSKMQGWSGPGLVMFGLTVTFAAIDWIMSLEPGWYSAIFGMLLMGGQGLSAMAFVIVMMARLSQFEPLSLVVKPKHLHDLGKLMLAFLMLWAYFAFSQFLIIWSGNIPEEAAWYVRRLNSGWKYIALAIVLIHFALPFVLLLSRDLKRNARTLSVVAITILVMRYVDLFWLTGPEFHEGHFAVSWMDLLMPIGIGGLWLWFFFGQLKARPLLPVQDPYLDEVLAPSSGH